MLLHQCGKLMRPAGSNTLHKRTRTSAHRSYALDALDHPKRLCRKTLVFRPNKAETSTYHQHEKCYSPTYVMNPTFVLFSVRAVRRIESHHAKTRDGKPVVPRRSYAHAEYEGGTIPYSTALLRRVAILRFWTTNFHNMKPHVGVAPRFTIFHL